MQAIRVSVPAVTAAIFPILVCGQRMPMELKAFAEEFNINYFVLIGDGRDDVKEAFGPLYGFPTTFIIGRDGKICTQHTGFASKEQFELEIKALL